MKIFKKILIALVVILLFAIGALFAIPYFFKDAIVEEVKKAVNENLNATIDFADIDISLLRDFPNVSLQIEDYSVTGKEEFDGIDLISGNSFGVSVDFWSAYNFGEVPLQIHSVDLDKPEMNMIILKNGKTNYDIVKDTGEETTETTPFQIELQSYSIADGHVIYNDQLWDTYVEMAGLNHSGKGDFTQDIFDLDTETTIEELTARSEGITYLKKAKLNYEAGFNIDMPNARYTLRENELKVNDLQVNTDGWLGLTEEGNVEMDLNFKAPQSDFKSLLSMIPNAYIAGYEDVKAGGKFTLEGFAKGIYSADPESYPTFKVNLNIANGDVKYPDLPVGITGINTDVVINSPSSNLDKMLIDVSQFNLNVGNNPIGGFFKLRTPMSDPDIDTKIKGKLDLGDLVRAFPMEGVQTLNGIIDVDMAAKTKMSTIDRGDYASVDMSGNASIERMDYVADDLPPVRIDAMRLFFTPKNVQIPNFDMKLGKSDLSGSGTIDNFLAYFSPDATMKGDLTLKSNYFNVDEWASDEEADMTAVSDATVTDEELFNRFDFKVDADIGKMDSYGYEIKDLKIKGQTTPNKLIASNVSGKIGDSDFTSSGVLTNIWDYVFENGTIHGEMKISSKYMNLNQFMTEEEATSGNPAEATEPFLVPGHIALNFLANMDKVLYDNLELKNVNGGMKIANEAITFEDVTAETLGGQMAIKGGYDTKDHEKPKFDIGMQLADMDFQKAFNAFNSFEAIAPIGKYINGNFNTRFSMNSVLGKDLMPVFETITADGFLQTINGKLAAFGPLEAISNKLNVSALKTIDIKNTKNWFKISDGSLELEEFDHQFEDIAMKIGGSHKIVGDGMSYYINAKIPREKFGKNPLGAAANSGLDMLSEQASKTGLSLDAGKFVNVRIGITGSISQPKIDIKFLGTDGDLDLKGTIADKANEEAGKIIDKAKEQALGTAKEETAKLEEKANEVIKDIGSEVKAKTEAKVDTLVKDVVKDAGKEVKEKVGEDIKKELDKWNPLKKKKKEGGG